MKKNLASLLSLMLVACSQTVPSQPVPLQSHLLEIQFNGVDTSHPSSTLLAGGTPLSKQGLVEVDGLTFAYKGAETYTSSDGGTRYIQVHYQVTNGSGASLGNLGFLPVVLSDTDGNASNNGGRSATVAGTPFSSVKHYDGTSAPSSTATALTPTYAKLYDPETDTLSNRTSVSTYRSNLVVDGFHPTNPSGLEITEVKNHGWQFQGGLASGASRIITFSASFPIPGDRKLAPYSFSMAAVYTNNIPNAGLYGTELNVDSGVAAYTPDLALNSQNFPVVAWEENGNVYTKQWNGSAWTLLGPTVGSTGGGAKPMLRVNTSNQAVVAYTQNTGSQANTYVKQWNGSSWTQLGGVLTGSNYLGVQDLALNTSQQPIVAYVQFIPQALYVKQWNGSSWTQLGSDLRVAAGSLFYTSVDAGSDGLPVVAWSENGALYVKKWNGSSWTQLGSDLAIDVNTGATYPDVQVNASGQPVVAWSENGALYVKKWNGSSWTQLGTTVDTASVDNGSTPNRPRLALSSTGTPSVVYVKEVGGVKANRLKTWNGSSWALQSGTYAFDEFQNTNTPVLQLDSTGTPVLAWMESDQVYVKR